MAIKKIFFQSSLPRSGSTLLQNIIAQNSDFYVTPTSGILELIYGARENYTNSHEFRAQDPDIMKKAFANFCLEGMKGYFEAITKKSYVIDKSRGWGYYFTWLEEILGEKPKIICMVRDARDIICSMEKKFRANPDKSSPLVNHAQMQGITTAQRVDLWFASQPFGLALTRLNEIIRQGNDVHMLFIRYEDLCLYPEREMNKVYDYLEIKPYRHNFKKIEQITKEDDEVYGIFGDHTIRTNLEMKHSDAKQVLGSDICKWIRDTGCPWYFEKFGYK